jgi:hypothetical protein
MNKKSAFIAIVQLQKNVAKEAVSKSINVTSAASNFWVAKDLYHSWFGKIIKLVNRLILS